MKDKQKLALLRGANGAYRKTYFEEGGDLSSWRGRSSIRVDRRKQSNKRACRKAVDRAPDY